MIDWDTPAGIYAYHGGPEGSPKADNLEYGILVVFNGLIGPDYKAQVAMNGSEDMYFRFGHDGNYSSWKKIAIAQ